MRTNFAIARFSFKQIRKGAVILGVAGAMLLLLQGVGFQKGFPSQAERTHIIASFEGNPVFKFLYAENDHADTPAGYMMYRSGQMLVLIGSLWALMFATKTLRGQEEDGRTEQLLAGQTTLGRATAQMITGIGAGLAVSSAIICLLLAVGTKQSGVDLEAGNAAWISLGVIGVVAFFAMLGAVTSQLAYTRRTALLYGVIPLILFFVMRSIGNSTASLYWLKDLTPFGWFDHLSPTFTAHPVWLLPLYVGALAFALAAIAIASRRDLGSALIKESDSAKPRFASVGSTLHLGLRLTKGSTIGWTLGCVGISAVVASIAKSAADALGGSSSIKNILTQITSDGPSFVEVFLSVGAMFVSILLLAMVVSGIGTMREEEGKGIADNLLVRNISRTRYLIERALILFGAASSIIILSSLSTWIVARQQGIDLDFWTFAADNLNILGPVVFFIGLGLLLLGGVPRHATAVLYIVLIWSFVSQLLASLVKDTNLLDIINNSSLLHHIALAPVSAPDWTSTAVSALLGLLLGGLGLYFYSRRDIETE
jgi:ABC-2 type transport system permease protein